MIILTSKIKWQNRAFEEKYSAGEFADVCNGHSQRRAGKLNINELELLVQSTALKGLVLCCSTYNIPAGCS
jgi:hypothetical protein